MGNFNASKSEHVTYSMYFFGQNLIWTFVGLVSTFLLDIGISPAVAGIILLAPKIWDAVNDTLFGFLVDRFRFKNNQRFLPWIKIGTAMLAVTVILMFSIPASIDNSAFKIAWFIAAYILFDAAYTMLDAPMFAMPTVMTENVQERTSLIAGNKMWAMIGAMIATVIIPIVRPKTGWLIAAVIFCALGMLFMLPFLFVGKERRSEKVKDEQYSFKDMFNYVKSNKYLLITLIVIFIMGVTSIESTLSLILARNCFGDESRSMIISLCVSIPVIIVSAIIPKLSKHIDKQTILIWGLAFSSAAGLASYFIGYKSLLVSGILIGLMCTGMAFYVVICYMFVADTVEYGDYKTGTRATGITFALQTFVSKLKSAFLGSVALGALAVFGYDSSLSESVIQSPRVVQGIWTVFNLLPVLGNVVCILLLVLFYKLKDRDVQVMASYNNGSISKKTAEMELSAKYGPAGNRK